MRAERKFLDDDIYLSFAILCVSSSHEKEGAELLPMNSVKSMRHDVILLFIFEARKRIGYVDVCRMAGRHKNKGSGGKTKDGKMENKRGRQLRE